MTSAEWQQMTLREAGVALLDCVHRTPPAQERGHPYVAIPQIKHGRIDLSDVRMITREHLEEWTRKAKPQAHDVILSRRCNPGETAYVPPGFEGALGQNLVLLRADGSKVFPPFLRWMARGQAWWEQVDKFINVGAVFDSLRCADIPNFRLPLPPRSIQRAIAAMLGSLDDKIELNRRMNETLEGMARALFKSWFVDFDPVHAKAAGKKPFGVDDATAVLFPTQFQESVIGDIPRKWTPVSVYDLATYVNGAAYRAFEPNGDRRGLPIIKIAELKAGVTSQTGYSDVEMPEKYRIDSGSILFSWSGNPDTSIDTFVWIHGPAWLNQHIFHVLPHADSERAFLLATLKSLRPVFAEIARNKQTTGLGHVTADDMKRLRVVKPTDDVVRAWQRATGPLFEKMFRAELETASLATLRDSLLPKLLSGELRIKDAEKIVGEAT